MTVSSSIDCGRRTVATTERHWASARRPHMPAIQQLSALSGMSAVGRPQQQHRGVPMALASADVTALHGWLPLLSNSDGGTATAVLGGDGRGFQASASNRVTTCYER